MLITIKHTINNSDRSIFHHRRRRIPASVHGSWRKSTRRRAAHAMGLWPVVPWVFSHGNHGPGEIFHGMKCWEKKHADNDGIYGIYRIYGIYGMGVPWFIFVFCCVRNMFSNLGYDIWGSVPGFGQLFCQLQHLWSWPTFQDLWNDHFGTYGSLMVPILHSQVDQLTFLFSFRTKIRADRSSLWSEPSWLPPKCREDHERS